jgi:hypothetical protein
MKTIKLYALQSIRESDYATSREDIYYAETKEVALKIAKSNSFKNKYLKVYRSDDYEPKDMIEEKEFIVLNSVDEFTDAEKHTSRKAALEKLTKEEKQLLGL